MFKLLKQYKWWLAALIVASTISNVLALLVPKVIASFIDAYDKTQAFSFTQVSLIIVGLSVVVYIFAVLQFVFSAYIAENIAFTLRHDLVNKIKNQSYSYIAKVTSSKLITNLTSDVDTVKSIASQGLVALFGALLTFVGVIVLLLSINMRLALYVLTIVPFIAVIFFLVFGNLSKLFKASQENLERINKVINESIVGAALVRVLNAGKYEMRKFTVTNETSRDLGMKIVKLFTILIPGITFLSNVSTLIILWYGGIDVANGTLSLGDMSAFFAYASMLVWPLVILSFSGTVFSRALVSFGRIDEVLKAPVDIVPGTYVKEIEGKVEFNKVTLTLAKHKVLKDVSFTVKPHTRTAIIGPTAAGKTQLFYILAGLIHSYEGEVRVDGHVLREWDHQALLGHMGLVFQESSIFSTTLYENIGFREGVSAEAVHKAIKAAELDDLVTSLPKGLQTMLNERGTNLSGGQKQRLMLARALAQEPKILLLDDFTARVDIATEQKIIGNIAKYYPGVTLISITQKIDPIRDYDQIIVLMEGELLDAGTHDELMDRSLEYRQMYESQQKVHD